MMNKQDLMEDEWLQVRHSGEIPEIAFHSAIHYLTEDEEGPKLTLREEDINYLLGAATSRYLEIILRDIQPENRDKTIYRGILRTISNWRRYKRFCTRHNLGYEPALKEIRSQLILFLKTEISEIEAGERESSINCTYADLTSFAFEIEVSLELYAGKLESICIDFN